MRHFECITFCVIQAYWGHTCTRTMALWKETVGNVTKCLQSSGWTRQITTQTSFLHSSSTGRWHFFWSSGGKNHPALCCADQRRPACCEATVVSHADKQKVKWRAGNTVSHFWCSCGTSLKWPNSTFHKVVDKFYLKKKKTTILHRSSKISTLYTTTGQLASLSVRTASFQGLGFLLHPNDTCTLGKTENIELAVVVWFLMLAPQGNCDWLPTTPSWGEAGMENVLMDGWDLRRMNS